MTSKQETIIAALAKQVQDLQKENRHVKTDKDNLKKENGQLKSDNQRLRMERNAALATKRSVPQLPSQARLERALSRTSSMVVEYGGTRR